MPAHQAQLIWDFRASGNLHFNHLAEALCPLLLHVSWKKPRWQPLSASASLSTGRCHQGCVASDQVSLVASSSPLWEQHGRTFLHEVLRKKHFRTICQVLRCKGVSIWLEMCDSNFNVERCQKNNLRKEQQNAKNEGKKKGFICRKLEQEFRGLKEGKITRAGYLCWGPGG